MNRRRRIWIGLAVLALLFGPAACSSSSDDSTPTPPEVTGDTFSFIEDDGSVTELTVGTSEFLARNETSGLQVWGTVTPMTSGFTRNEVTYSNTSDMAEGDVFYALPVSGAILPVLMANEKSTYEEAFYNGDVGLALGGSCPTDLDTYVTVLGPDPTLDQATDKVYGHARINGAGPFDLQRDMRVLGSPFTFDSLYSPLMTGFSCTDGQATNDSGDTMIFTAGAMALAMSGNTDNTYVMLPLPATLTAADIVASGRQYAGWAEYVSDDPASPGDRTTVMVPLALTGDGTNLVGGPFSDFANGVAGPTAVLSVDGGPLAGVFDLSGLAFPDDPLRTVRLVASQLNGKVVMLAVSQDDNGPTPGFDNDPEDWTFIVLVQTN